MWNILIVVIIAIIIWMFNPFLRTQMMPTASVDKKTQTEVNQVESEVRQQVDKSRQLQKEAQNSVNY